MNLLCACVRVCTHEYVINVRICASTYACVIVSTHVHVRVRACTRLFMHNYVLLCTHMNMCTWMYVCVRLNTHIYVYQRMCTCMCWWRLRASTYMGMVIDPCVRVSSREIASENRHFQSVPVRPGARCIPTQIYNSHHSLWNNTSIAWQSWVFLSGKKVFLPGRRQEVVAR